MIKVVRAEKDGVIRNQGKQCAVKDDEIKNLLTALGNTNENMDKLKKYYENKFVELKNEF